MTDQSRRPFRRTPIFWLSICLLVLAAGIAAIGAIVDAAPAERFRVQAQIALSTAPSPVHLYSGPSQIRAEFVEDEMKITKRYESSIVQDDLVKSLGLEEGLSAEVATVLASSLKMTISPRTSLLVLEFVAPSREIGADLVQAIAEYQSRFEEPLREEFMKAAVERLRMLEEDREWMQNAYTELVSEVFRRENVDPSSVTAARQLAPTMLAWEIYRTESSKRDAVLAAMATSIALRVVSIDIGDMSGVYPSFAFTLAMGTALAALGLMGAGLLRHGTSA